MACIVWVKDALERLSLAGLIPADDAQALEDEGMRLGRHAKGLGLRKLVWMSKSMR